MRIPFIGPSYRLRSINRDAQRCINWFPVKSELQTSKNIDGLQGTPGKLVFANPDNGEIRGEWQTLGRAFVVSGNKLYEIDEDGNDTELGTLNTTSGRVGMCDNGQQLVIVDGDYGYILTLETDIFLEITSEGWRGSNTVSFVGGYFIFIEPDTGVFYICALYDGFTIDALDFASAEGAPDNLVAGAALAANFWAFGTETVQVYYNSGDTFPFTPIDNAFIQYGCSAAHSVAQSANTIFWLGGGKEGAGVVWMATGYNPQRISTFALEYAISTYGDVSDAFGYTYEEEGHYFYCLNFPGADTTWCYDIGLNEWHERGYWNSQLGEYEKDLANSHMFVFGKHLVGSRRDGKIYEQSMSYLDDNGDAIRRLRTSPHTFDGDDLNFIYFSQAQLDMETGIGNSEEVNPTVSLSWSNDAGHTFSNEHSRGVGRVGEYKARAIWRQLGRSRDRVWRVITTARARLCLIGFHVQGEKGAN